MGIEELPGDDKVVARLLRRVDPVEGGRVAVPRGWRTLVDTLDRDIAALFPDYTLREAKEKYGLLVFTVETLDGTRAHHHDRLRRRPSADAAALADVATPPSLYHDAEWFRAQEVSALIDAAEMRSARTCAVCAASGTIRTVKTWVAPLCDTCASLW